MRREEEEEEEEGEGEKMNGQNVDLSGLSLDAISNPSSFNPALITKLDLSNNNLQDIPESLTARLLNVVVVDVHSNQLRLLPNSIGCLSKLKVLNVSGNLLESLPKTIEDCKALEELNANFNKLTKLPDTIGFELTKLRTLSVNSNKLACLPYSTSHMRSLRVLDARMNCLRSLPEGLENLIRLQVLNVSQNFQFLRALPYSIGLLVSLVELDLSYNSITHLPNSIACLANLQKLRVEGNPIISPPIEVMEQSVQAVRIYLTARMNHPGTTDDQDQDQDDSPAAKKPWFKKLVRCGTSFNSAGSSTISSHRGIMEEHNGFLLSDYRSINGLTSPRYVGGIFSPRRLFSPRRASTPKH